MYVGEDIESRHRDLQIRVPCATRTIISVRMKREPFGTLMLNYEAAEAMSDKGYQTVLQSFAESV
jgi:hypothetical protein